jgi:glyoxylase-like metal-dependent hydrolase (beta-lactamase superfamily II)
MTGTWDVDVLLAGTGYSSSCTLAVNHEHRVVIDTGLSFQEDALASALAERRLKPEDIDVVINTHLHVDHCGNNSIFRRAAIFMSEREWQWTRTFYAALFGSRRPELVIPDFYPEVASYSLSTRTVRNVARMARMFWDEERLGRREQFRWLEHTPLPSGLDALPTPGHTPHHVSIRMSASKPVVAAGDAVLAQNADAKVKTMIPFSRAQFAATREALLQRGETIVPGHGTAFMPIRPAATPPGARTSPR